MNRKGFTLIELLIVVVIIGILAAIAIPKFSSTREKAFRSAMQTDLRNLATQQEIYYSDNSYTYATTTTALDFTPSEGVGVTIAVSGGAWTATATHDALSGESCEILGGSHPAGTETGKVTCTGGGS